MNRIPREHVGVNMKIERDAIDLTDAQKKILSVPPEYFGNEAYNAIFVLSLTRAYSGSKGRGTHHFPRDDIRV